jgi:hypothetical protein
MTTPETRLPATPIESAIGFDLMRALIARLLINRKTPLVGTAAAGEASAGLMVRVVLDRDGAIRAWLEEPDESLRHGVPYVTEKTASRMAGGSR